MARSGRIRSGITLLKCTILTPFFIFRITQKWWYSLMFVCKQPRLFLSSSSWCLEACPITIVPDRSSLIACIRSSAQGRKKSLQQSRLISRIDRMMEGMISVHGTPVSPKPILNEIALWETLDSVGCNFLSPGYAWAASEEELL